MAIRRDGLRLKLLPARSIEETGLDASLYGAFLSPHGALSPVIEARSTPALSKLAPESLPTKGRQTPLPQTPFCSKCQHEEKSNPEDTHLERKKELLSAMDQQNARKRPTSNAGMDSELRFFKEGKQVAFSHLEESEENVSREGVLHKGPHELALAEGSLVPGDGTLKDNVACNPLQLAKGKLKPESNGFLADEEGRPHTKLETITEKAAFSFTRKRPQEVVPSSIDDSDQTLSMNEKSLRVDPSLNNGLTHQALSFVAVSPGITQSRTLGVAKSPQDLDIFPSSPSISERFGKIPDSTLQLESKPATASGINGFVLKQSLPSTASSKVDARSRWKRAAHSVKFINRLAVNIRLAATDLIEDKAVDEMMQQHVIQDDAGGVGAAAFEGAKTVARLRSRGRKGMEGLLVQQDRCFITFLQDSYVACLKMPIGHFLIGVFLAPLVLGLLFTPLYLLDVDGLSFNGIVPEDATTSPFVSARQRCLAFLNIFLYALSLSTTFGGAPVAANSPFCLLVANMNTLMAQFLFVFLSGAVFARMSQPSYPIRCSKKAIIKTDDLLPVLGLEQQENLKVFAVRLVLTGPPPCELVDAKICLTFRIFVTLPSGSVFCSTQDLEVVRPEVSYLRYGLMVRHIIDKKSPVYGHTMETLYEGDASFSLTIMGLERTSMQPVFHLEDYFVCDDDVIWEGDYEDFIRLDKRGQRILDHSRIDVLKPMKAATRVSQAVSRMKNLKQEKEEKMRGSEAKEVLMQSAWPRKWFDLHRRKLAKSMSTSFTRADW